MGWLSKLFGRQRPERHSRLWELAGLKGPVEVLSVREDGEAGVDPEAYRRVKDLWRVMLASGASASPEWIAAQDAVELHAMQAAGEELAADRIVALAAAIQSKSAALGVYSKLDGGKAKATHELLESALRGVAQ